MSNTNTKTANPKNNDLIINNIMTTLTPGTTLKLKLNMKISIYKLTRFNELSLQQYLTKMTKKYLSKHEIREIYKRKALDNDF